MTLESLIENLNKNASDKPYDLSEEDRIFAYYSSDKNFVESNIEDVKDFLKEVAEIVDPEPEDYYVTSQYFDHCISANLLYEDKKLRLEIDKFIFNDDEEERDRPKEDRIDYPLDITVWRKRSDKEMKEKHWAYPYEILGLDSALPGNLPEVIKRIVVEGKIHAPFSDLTNNKK